MKTLYLLLTITLMTITLHSQTVEEIRNEENVFKEKIEIIEGEEILTIYTEEEHPSIMSIYAFADSNPNTKSYSVVKLIHREILSAYLLHFNSELFYKTGELSWLSKPDYQFEITIHMPEPEDDPDVVGVLIRDLTVQ